MTGLSCSRPGALAPAFLHLRASESPCNRTTSRSGHGINNVVHQSPEHTAREVQCHRFHRGLGANMNS